MSHKNEILIELLIILTLPIALFAGCTQQSSKNNDAKSMDMNVEFNYSEPLTSKVPEVGLEYGAPASYTKNSDYNSKNFANFMSVNESFSTPSFGNHRKPTIVPNEYVLFYETGADTIPANYFGSLRQHALFLNQNPDIMLNIEVYSNDMNSDKANMHLSSLRAKHLVLFLHKLGVSNLQLVVNTYAESVKKDSFENDLSRRTELVYSKITNLLVMHTAAAVLM